MPIFGGGGPTVESNTLFGGANIQVVDVICEGEIAGLADQDG